jgi:hypothetical protein
MLFAFQASLPGASNRYKRTCQRLKKQFRDNSSFFANTAAKLPTIEKILFQADGAVVVVPHLKKTEFLRITQILNRVKRIHGIKYAQFASLIINPSPSCPTIRNLARIIKIVVLFFMRSCKNKTTTTRWFSYRKQVFPDIELLPCCLRGF